MLPTPRLSVVFLQNSLLAVALIFLLQFAYRFPILLPELRREAWLVLMISLLYAVWECAVAVFRFVRLGQNQVEYREIWSDYLLLLLLLWVSVAFLRQMRALNRRNRRKDARAMAFFVLIFLFVVGLAVFNILRGNYRMGVDLADFGLSAGILLALLLFAVTYLYNQPRVTSFLVRISGVTLTLLLAIMGAAGWVLSPALEPHFKPAIVDLRTLRFTPNHQGGYNIAQIPFMFENNLGSNLHLEDYGEYSCSTPLDFPFPFYGKVYPVLYACNDGTISMGQPEDFRAYQYRYGADHPLIFALLLDLDPTLGEGGIYASQTPDRLIITWDKVRGFRNPNDEYTFQAILYPDGVFDLNYKGLPASAKFHPNDDPGANVWMIGAVPGDSSTPPEQVNFAGLPLQTGPGGAVEDYLLEFRTYIDQFLTPVVGLILGGSLLILLVFPLLFYLNLVKPLAALMQGVRHLEMGDYSIQVAVQSPDEIGYLTNAFNHMTHELNDLIGNLSAKVTERTAELAEALAQAEAVREQLAVRNADLDAFAHTVAHDIRSPVANVALSAQRLDHLPNSLSPEEMAQTAHTILQSANHLIRILDELLLLAGLRNVEVQPEPLNMGAIVQAAYSRLEHIIQATGATVDLPARFDWPVALGHPGWVEEIWYNYLSNACRYGSLPDHPAHISLGTDCSTDGSLVRFWVRDNGIGLTPQEQARLFVPFTQLHQVRAQGHGLGLSIVRRIAEKLGGGVSVESSAVPGQGSLFAFTLPAAPPGTPLPPNPVAADASLPATSNLLGLRVLLVDDETTFAESMRSLLTSHGMSVVGIAPNGTAAIQLSRDLNPQFILMDIDMPHLNGLQATRAIKTAQPQVKIVMLTALESNDTLFEALRGGASGYLLKGAPVETLIAQLAGLARGEVPLSPGLAERVLAELSPSSAPDSPTPPGEARLTGHQWDILARVAAGQTYKQIAAELFLTERTIKYHMGQIIDLLQVDNRTQAIAYLRNRPNPPQ